MKNRILSVVFCMFMLVGCASSTPRSEFASVSSGSSGSIEGGTCYQAGVYKITYVAYDSNGFGDGHIPVNFSDGQFKISLVDNPEHINWHAQYTMNLVAPFDSPAFSLNGKEFGTVEGDIAVQTEFLDGRSDPDLLRVSTWEHVRLEFAPYRPLPQGDHFFSVQVSCL